MSAPGSRREGRRAPGGVEWTHLPGLYRSNYPAPHAEACCDPDRGRVRPLPLVRGGRPHRDVRRHRPRHRADRLPARLPRPAHRQQHHHRRRGAGRRRAAAPLRRQPDRQQPGQAHQRRRLPPAGPDRPERHGARGRREGAAGRPGGHPAHHRRRRHQHGGGRPGGVPRDPGLRAHGRRAPQDHRQRHRADPAEPRRADRGPAGLPVRPERPRRARLQPADAHRPRGDGAGQRLADRRSRPRLHGLARRAGVAPRHRPRRAEVGDPRGLRARAGDRPRRRGGPPARGHGRDRLRQHLPRRGGRRRRHRRPPRGVGRDRATRPLRARPDRHHQPGPLLRRPLRRGDRRREEDGAEVRLLLPLRTRQRDRPRPHPRDGRARRRAAPSTARPA